MSKRKQNQTRRQWLRHQANRYAHRAKASRPESGSRVIRIDDAFYLCHAQRGVHLVIEGPDHLLAMIEVPSLRLCQMPDCAKCLIVTIARRRHIRKDARTNGNFASPNGGGLARLIVKPAPPVVVRGPAGSAPSARPAPGTLLLKQASCPVRQELTIVSRRCTLGDRRCRIVSNGGTGQRSRHGERQITH